MAYNPYEILNVSKELSLDEITAEFSRQKSELMNSVLSEGEAGNRAAERLQSIKDAYEEIKYLKSANASISEENMVRPLGKVEELVKQNELVEAQKLLDAQSERGAEWHYIQAALFFKQGWIFESRKQLELASRLSPNEEKYSKALKSLNNVVNFGHPEGPMVSEEGYTRSYPENKDMNYSDAGCCKVCGMLILADCCCDCFAR